MTTLDVEHFIAAVLWLDKPNTELSNPLIELLKQLSGVQQKFLQVTAREKLAELKESLLVDLAGLAQASPGKEKREALKHRLKFITQANAMYTDALGAARKAVISALKSEIAKEKSIKETKRYLDDLESVLPDGVKDDAELRKAIYDAKRKLVYDHFEDDYKKILKKYETQMEFLRTGELSLWEKIEATFTGEDPRALTEENLDKWRSKFLHELTTTLTVHAQIAVDMAGYGQNPTDREEAEAVHYFLKERIRDDYKELSRKAKQDLIGLTDLRGQRARERLDRIFGLKPSQPVDKKAFLRCYLAVASYQTYYRNDAVLADAGRDFIREFHEIAQHEGGFVTQIVAKMSKDELDALFLTWGDDPTVKVKKKSQGKSTALESDIVGVVDASRDSHVQVPRYLLLNMVLELIAADFDALLRGEKVDIRLLNDRIEFAIPKLQRQVKDEMELNGNRELRGDLAAMIQGMNPTTTRDSYLRLVANQLPQGTAQFDTYGVMRNLKDCESKLLDQIRFALRDQLDILDGITPEHLDYRSDEESIKILEQQILLLRDELERVQRDGQMEEGTRAEKTVVIARSIASLEAQKMEYANNIAVKKAQTKWVRDYQEYLVEAQSLLKNDGLSLREFIAQMKPCLFELLDPQLAGFCRAVRENVEFAKLLGDEEFTRQLHQLGRDLQGNTRETLDIVRDIPENITRQLPSETADMIRQLQYRFADRFKHLMVKMLDKNNLSKIHASDEASAMSVATVPVQDKTTPFWGSLFTGSTKPVTVPNVTASKPSMPTVHERLKTVLKRVESRVLKQMLAQLAEAADANSMNIDDLYGLTGEIKPSKPIAIAARSSDSSQDPSQEGQRQGMHVGNPFARNYYF
ncbi:hypothetical protein AQUSIP_06220 [Aquicella siphonis]|uniref:Uncharacterized protein n=1 Tax=Aquicella siphonis TaxID=254247 RepID=A0A5E4PG18_9COXI|nr:hypothetical protein [Aquicella siphonis]VVC75333.1 hypothetical protein AQUSIP_06220 [Aquicella siphonis]